MLLVSSPKSRKHTKSKPLSSIQTLSKSEIEPIIVTTLRRYVNGGMLEWKGWSGIQNVRQPPLSAADIAPSVNQKEDPAYFREGHVVDPYLNVRLDYYE